MKTHKAVKRIINSVWTIEYRLIDANTVKLISYSRDDKEGYNREHELPKGDVIEEGDRIVTGIKVGDKQFAVSNPGHVFSFKCN